jgi:HEAT repeat protein
VGAKKLPATAAAVAALYNDVTSEICRDRRNMAKDDFDITNIPKPGTGLTASSDAVTAEVVGADQGRRKEAKTSVRPAEEALRQAAPKAVETLVACLESNNEWVRITAARAIMERVIPVAVDDDPETRAVLIFPSGSKMAVMLPEAQEALSTLRRTVE